MLSNSRLVLLAGFGGLLALMALAGLDGVRAVRQIQTANDRIREDFLLRTRLLERIRGDVYVSGTYVRDYLLEPESGKAEGHRYSLLESRRDTDEALAGYRGMLQAPERAPFEGLTRELDTYWRVLEPVFQWTPEQRRKSGYPFLRDEVFPRRMAMLGIADQIRGLNEAQMEDGKRRLEEFYQQYRQRLIFAIVLVIGVGLVLAAFSMRKILALEREGSHSREALQQLSARLVQAQEEERRTISRELHDEVGQGLTGVLLELANLSTLIRGRDEEGASAKAAEIKHQVEGSIGVLRNMALLLRPSMLDDLGLIPALQWQAREVSRRSGLRVTVDAEGVGEELPETHKTCVYRIVQEALHNCVRHAGAKQATITVRQAGSELTLRIQDDGRGFRPEEEGGMGLLGMRERVGYLNGEFRLDSTPGQGARLQVVLPL